MKQLLHDFLSHPWVDCKEAADGADGRAECGIPRTSWGPSRYMYRYQKSATAVQLSCITDFPLKMFAAKTDFPAVFGDDSIFSLRPPRGARALNSFQAFIHPRELRV